MKKDILFMIEQAVKAPSGHNTQPWLFKFENNRIDICPDFEKCSPVVDPDNRELYISLGCALENLCLTASYLGYDCKISITENGVISVYLKENFQSTDGSKIWKLIEKRQANRKIYNSEIIADEVLSEIQTINQETDIKLYLWKNGTNEFKILTDCIAKGNTIQMQDKAFIGELKNWIRFNKKQTATTNNGISYAVFDAPNLPAFILKPVMSKFLNPKTQNASDLKRIQSSSHLVLFTIKSNTITEWVKQGRCLQQFLLKLTEHNIAHSYFNQPCEIESLSNELKQSLSFDSEYPVILLRIGYCNKQAAYSHRKPISEVIK